MTAVIGVHVSIDIIHLLNYGGPKGRPSRTWNIPHGAFPCKHRTFPHEH